MAKENIKNKSKKQRVKKEVTKCAKCNKPFSYDPETQDKPEYCAECEAKRNAIVFRGKCKECGKSFYVRGKEADWLKENGLEMPKRCFECRSFRKIQKQKKEAESKKEAN